MHCSENFCACVLALSDMQNITNQSKMFYNIKIYEKMIHDVFEEYKKQYFDVY